MFRGVDEQKLQPPVKEDLGTLLILYVDRCFALDQTKGISGRQVNRKRVFSFLLPDSSLRIRQQNQKSVPMCWLGLGVMNEAAAAAAKQWFISSPSC